MVFLTDRLADLRALQQAGLRAIQPYCPQTWQTAILLADSMAILLLTNWGEVGVLGHIARCLLSR